MVSILFSYLCHFCYADKSLFTLDSGVFDFSSCVIEEDGKCCLLSNDSPVQPVSPTVVECVHKKVECFFKYLYHCFSFLQVESCHYTYVTQFSAHQEEVCTENYQKKCFISFVSKAKEEIVRKCYRPLVKQCQTKEGEEVCRSFPETSCTTKYLKKGAKWKSCC